MKASVVSHLSSEPQRLVDLQWLEEELYDVSQDEVSLNWNKQHRCVEHKFSGEWEVEYCVLEHWAEHVGAKFNITDDQNKDGYYSAYIYN